MGNMNQHGIFINYKRSHKHIAVRIYDYFRFKGLNPFIDLYYTSQTEYADFIAEQIRETPYFLCILTKDGLDDLLDPARRTDDPNKDLYYKEIKIACEQSKAIFVLASEDVNYEVLSDLPQEIKKIKDVSFDFIPDDTLFYSFMDRLFEKIDLGMMREHVNWRNYSVCNANTLILPRTKLEHTTATLNNRFGKEFVECVKNGEKYTGEYRIKEINMVCYAASLVAAPDRNKVDRRAYDSGIFSRIFTYLLEDPDFSLSIVVNAPQSNAVADAVEYEKIGNDSFKGHHGFGVFLVSYANFDSLKNEEPYKSALLDNRFNFMVTDCVLPYALFQIIYKDERAEFNHIRIDLYSYGIYSNEDRRCMIIFEKDDKVNYDFFARQIETLKNNQNRLKSEKLIKKYHKKWIRDWKNLEK